MGNHQSHVYNKTYEEVYIVLKAPGGDFYSLEKSIIFQQEKDKQCWETINLNFIYCNNCDLKKQLIY